MIADSARNGAVQKRYSVVHVTSPETYVNGLPRPGGLADLLMGSVDKYDKCATDGLSFNDGCPGYFGHIELAKPLFHIGYLKTVLKVLRCVSYQSSKFLLTEDDEADEKKLAILRRIRMGPARLDRAHKFCQTKTKDKHTGASQPKYKLDKLSIIAEFPKPKENDNIEEGEQQVERRQVRRPPFISRLPAPGCA